MDRANIFVLLVSLGFDISLQYPTGAPASRCNNLMPSHQGAISQNSQSPYEIFPSLSSIGNGHTMNVEIRSIQMNRPFAGFLLQARATLDPFEIVGEFQETTGSSFNFRDCSGYRTTVTNANNNRSLSLNFNWAAPLEFTGLVTFHATMIEDFSTFWVNQTSNNIEVIIAEPPSTTSTEAPEFDIYDGCDDTKTCFGIGDVDCVRNRRCLTVGAVIYEEEKFIFEMRASVGANYVGFALSYDNRMGEDSVIECVNENNLVRAFTSFTSVIDGFSSPRIENQTIIRLVKSRFENGMIYCQVERDAMTTVKGVNFNLIDDKHFLLLASGSRIEQNSIGYHDINVDASSEAFLLTDISVVRPRSRAMLYLHASSMLVAWIGMTSIGIFTARFMKRTWTDVKIFGKDFWFMTHQISMASTWLLTLIGFIVILVDSNRWMTNTHSVCGTIVFTLTMIQPIAAVFRPAPATTLRPIFNYLHLSAGNLAHLAAVITMFYAVNLTRAQLPRYFTFVLISYVVIYVTFYTSMTIMGILDAQRMDNRSDSTAELTMLSVSNTPFYQQARKISFITFVLITLMFVIGLTTILSST